MHYAPLEIEIAGLSHAAIVCKLIRQKPWPGAWWEATRPLLYLSSTSSSLSLSLSLLFPAFLRFFSLSLSFYLYFPYSSLILIPPSSFYLTLSLSLSFRLSSHLASFRYFSILISFFIHIICLLLLPLVLHPPPIPLVLFSFLVSLHLPPSLALPSFLSLLLCVGNILSSTKS